MARILQVVGDGQMRKLLALNLEMYTGSEIIFQGNADDTIDFLKENEDVDLIVTENSINEENTVLKIYYFINSQKKDVPIILLGSNSKVSEEVISVEPHDWQKVVKEGAKVLGITAEIMIEKDVPDYYPIKTQNFLLISKTATDIYKLNADGDYESFLKSGQSFARDIIDKLIIEKHDYLYVKKEHRLRFVNHYSREIASKLNSEGLSKAERLKIMATAFNTVRDLINAVGLNDEAKELAKASIDSMITTVHESPELSDLLSILEKNPESYLYQHCLLISVMAHHTIGKIEWGSKEQKAKIPYVAFFHDIALAHNDLAKIHSQEELDKANLTPEEKKAVEEHALRAKELVKSYPKLPLGIDVLILQHHGQMNGIGFTDSLDNRISPLAILFRVIEDFVSELMIKGKESFQFDEAIQRLKKTYDKGQYRKVVEALEKTNS